MSVCVLQPSSQRPTYPQTRPPPVPAVQALQAAAAAAEPSQVRLCMQVHSAECYLQKPGDPMVSFVVHVVFC